MPILKKSRKFSAKFKFKVVIESLVSPKKVSEIAKEYNLHPQLLTNWRREFFQKGYQVFEGQGRKKRIEKDKKNLEKTIKRQEIEIQFLKKTLSRLA